MAAQDAEQTVVARAVGIDFDKEMDMDLDDDPDGDGSVESGIFDIPREDEETKLRPAKRPTQKPNISSDEHDEK